MNLNMIRPKRETEGLLLSLTKNCETFIDQTHRKAVETLDFKLTKPRETFHFKPPISIEGSWMTGLTSLEVYNTIFNITERNNKFEIYRDTSTKFEFLELKDDLEEILKIPHITPKHLQDDEIGRRIIDEFLKISHENKNSDGYMILLLGYGRSLFRDSESYLRIVIGLDEEDIQLISKKYNSHFITYELTPGIYTIQDISVTIHTFSGHSEIKEIEYDDISMKTKVILKYIGGQRNFGLRTLRFDGRSFFLTLLGFEPYWDYKPTNSIRFGIPNFYISDKIFYLSTTNKIHLKCDVIEGSVVNGLRQPILYSFELDKLPGYQVFCEPETIHYKKNKSVLNVITFSLEDDNNEEVNFNGETLTFTLPLIKI